MPALIESLMQKIRSRRAAAQASTGEQFAALARDLADGREVDPARADAVLRAAGATEADLRRAVERFETFRSFAAQARRAPALRTAAERAEGEAQAARTRRDEQMARLAAEVVAAEDKAGEATRAADEAAAALDRVMTLTSPEARAAYDAARAQVAAAAGDLRWAERTAAGEFVGPPDLRSSISPATNSKVRDAWAAACAAAAALKQAEQDYRQASPFMHATGEEPAPAARAAVVAATEARDAAFAALRDAAALVVREVERQMPRLRKATDAALDALLAGEPHISAGIDAGADQDEPEETNQ